MAEKLYTCILRCRQCNAELNRAEHVPEHKRGMVAMTSALAGMCEVRSHNTASDINFGGTLEWIEEVDHV